MTSRSQNIETVTNAAYALGVPVEIALAQANHESGFRDNAVGKDGERGLMQPLPATWRNVMPEYSFDRAYEPDINMIFWQRYFGSMLNQFGWDYRKALTAYNGGPGVFSRPSLPRAQAYADAILNAAGWGSGPNPTAAAIPSNVDDTSQPLNAPEGSGLLLPIAIGAVLLLFFLARD